METRMIHINDQGELLLIEAPDKESYRYTGIADDATVEKHYQLALSEAIEKGIKFRDQEAVIQILLKEKFKGHIERDELKCTLQNLPNSYTANTIQQRKHKDSDVWVNCDPVSVDEDGSYSYRKVAILISLKHARSHSSETIKKVLDTITPEEQEETERKMLSGNEAKKEEAKDIQKSKLINYELLLHQITSIVDHFEPSPSNPVYNQWCLLKKHTSDFKKIAGYLTKPLK